MSPFWLFRAFGHILWDACCDLVAEARENQRRIRRGSRFSPLHVEELTPRIVPAGPPIVTTTELWVAPASAIVQGQGAASWDVGTNWSEGHPPNANEGATFDPFATSNGLQGTNTPCYIPSGDNLPTLQALTLNNWGVANNENQAGTLTLNSDLAADSVTINPRTNNAGNSEIIINSGSHLYVLQTLTWAGGNVTGDGNFELGGNDSINGTSTTDQPTLGAYMNVGTSYLKTGYTGTLTFTANTQPLVVKGSNAQISVNSGSSLLFNDQAAEGQSSATAISNGETLSHTLLVNGGTVSRINVCQLYVAMGLDVNSGQVNVSNPTGQTSGKPLHFTGSNGADGSGLENNGGTLNLQADVTSDKPGYFLGGTTTIASNATLTLGVNANSAVNEQDGGTVVLQGSLVSHGGFSILAGTFGTGGSITSNVTLDTGNSFNLNGGELDVTLGGTGKGAAAKGYLTINGDFAANGGKVVITVDSTQPNQLKQGKLIVSGNATLTTSATFVSEDLNTNIPPGYANNWFLMNYEGTRTGDFTYSLPPNWRAVWQGQSMVMYERN